MTTNNINLINTARFLSQPPVGRQRLIEQLKQQRTIHAVVTDKSDDIMNMVSNPDYARGLRFS